ncbi:hypothetical protein DERF_012200 [Dermatophagoides farinae]|uniref:Uncharacterized protein n=1 Tax=Dermatophagoides farinae TaxID=6954 RepID=A0A922KY08_DERFA|nr:hypothetical protein DERF_012200 [Dermatophagoides farinae]
MEEFIDDNCIFEDPMDGDDYNIIILYLVLVSCSRKPLPITLCKCSSSSSSSSMNNIRRFESISTQL